MNFQGRILALDHGSRRIGVAWSDPLLITAQPGCVIVRANPAADLARLREIIEDKEATLIVVGLPLNMDGSEGPQAKEARRFMAWIAREVEVPVEPWDERLTSLGADEILDQRGVHRASPKGRKTRKAERDAIAASLLLASYLEANRARLRPDPPI